jgi:putative transcriptional regulator
MAKKKKRLGRLTTALLETADDMQRSGVMGSAAHDKITMRHLGEVVAEPAVEPMSGEEIRRARAGAFMPSETDDLPGINRRKDNR